MRALWLMVGMVGCGSSPTGAAKGSGDAAVPVQTVEVAPTAMAPRTSAIGTLVAEAVVVVRSEMSGRVVDVAFEDGAEVRAGDVLVRLDDAEARARVAEAEASLALARAAAARVEDLAGREHSSAAEVDRVRADVALGEARRDLVVEALRRTVVRAPLTGRVGLREVRVGDVVEAGRAITTLVDRDPLRAEARIAERLGAWLKVGQSAGVRLEGTGGALLPAVVDYVDPTVDTLSGTVRLRVRITDPPADVTPGGTVRVEVDLGPEAPVVTVPSEAVLTQGEGAAVWVVEADAARLVPVTLGERLAGDIVVTAGLDAGAEVVVQGILRLRPGAAVRRVNTPDVAPSP